MSSESLSRILAATTIVTALILALLASCGELIGPPSFDSEVPHSVTYTITYDLNSGSGITPSSQTVNAGNSLTLAGGSGFSRSGYTFDGWNTNSSGTGVNYSPGSSFTPTGSITLYARWSQNAVTTYTVSYNINGGSGTTPSSQSVNAGNCITVNSGNNISRSGYTFAGWNTSSSGTGSNYSGGSSYCPSSSITLYAKWSINIITYTLTVNGNPSIGGTVTGSGTFNEGTDAPISATASSGYTFSGWTGAGVANSSSASTTVSMTANRTVTANFQQVPTSYFLIVEISAPYNSSTVISGIAVGTVTANGRTGGIWEFSPGASVTLTATPASLTTTVSNNFLGWYEGYTLISTNQTTTITMNDNRRIEARFKWNF